MNMDLLITLMVLSLVIEEFGTIARDMEKTDLSSTRSKAGNTILQERIISKTTIMIHFSLTLKINSMAMTDLTTMMILCIKNFWTWAEVNLREIWRNTPSLLLLSLEIYLNSSIKSSSQITYIKTKFSQHLYSMWAKFILKLIILILERLSLKSLVISFRAILTNLKFMAMIIRHLINTLKKVKNKKKKSLNKIKQWFRIKRKLQILMLSMYYRLKKKKE